MKQSFSRRGELTRGMIRSAIFILAAVQLAAGDPRLPGPTIYTYSIELDRALPKLPPGFVPTLSFSFSPNEQWFAVLVGAHGVIEIHAAGPVVGSTLLLTPVSLLGQPSGSRRADASMEWPVLVTRLRSRSGTGHSVDRAGFTGTNGYSQGLQPAGRGTLEETGSKWDRRFHSPGSAPCVSSERGKAH